MKPGTLVQHVVRPGWVGIVQSVRGGYVYVIVNGQQRVTKYATGVWKEME